MKSAKARLPWNMASNNVFNGFFAMGMGISSIEQHDSSALK
jgi:hypothetical protein